MSGNTKVSFTDGGTVFVWKKTGVMNGKSGIQTSERTGLDYPDIEPDEPLKVVQRFGSTKALCRRGKPARKGQPDMEVLVHINHVNAKSQYYAARKDKAGTATLTEDQKITRAKAMREEADRILAEAGVTPVVGTATPDEAAMQPVEEPSISQADREAAEKLFEEDPTSVADDDDEPEAIIG